MHWYEYIGFPFRLGLEFRRIPLCDGVVAFRPVSSQSLPDLLRGGTFRVTRHGPEWMCHRSKSFRRDSKVAAAPK